MDDVDVYAVKHVAFLGKPVAVICQNINGPCPLLAICNVLLLRGHLAIADLVSPAGLISARDLLRVVQRRLVDANPLVPGSSKLEKLTREKTLQDVISLLPSLLVGLDVNVRFHKITDFEYTVECAVFDMLDIALVHGWLLDAQDANTLKVVQNKSYNELVALLVEYRSVMMTEGENESSETAAPAVPAVEVNDAAAEEESSPSAPAPPDEGAAGSSTDVGADGELETKLAPLVPVVNDFSNLTVDTDMIEAEAPTTPSSRSSLSSPTQKKSPSKQTVQTMMRERHISDADAMSTATVLLDQGPVLEEFFNLSASQLTYYGLVKLHEGVRERQLCVFFRNNHFSTLFKHNGSLYLLVTDAGYLDEPTVVWERLNEIDGDTEYFDANFQPLNVSETNQQSILTRQEQEKKRALEAQAAQDGGGVVQQGLQAAACDDPDYLFALQLQQEEEARVKRSTPGSSPRRNPSPVNRPPVSAIEAAAAVEEAESENRGEISSMQNSSSGSQFAAESDSYHGAAGGASDVLPFTEDGRLLISEEELEAQRQAERFYQERKRQHDQQTYQLQMQQQQQQQRQPQQQQPQGSDGRRKSKNDGDCSIM